jgi:adenylate kinase
MPMLYVGGVTGSGKSTTCARIAELLCGRGRVIHVGGLACELGGVHNLTGDSIEDTSVHALDQLQRLLAQTIQDLKGSAPAGTVFILDAHFTLGGIQRPPYRMPEWFFSRLGIDSLVLCTPSVSEIHLRIRTNPERVRPALIVETLEYYAAVESEHAHFVSRLCNIPLMLIEDARQVRLDTVTRRLAYSGSRFITQMNQ